MKAAHITTLFCMLLLGVGSSWAQSKETRISKLVVEKKKKEIFNSRDSSITLIIDTLILKDKSSLQFYGKKNVKLIVQHAQIGKNVFISGIGAQNNASNFDINIRLYELGSLYVLAKGQDATNGTRTFPNGDGGQIHFNYFTDGITPQTTNKKEKNYLHTDVSPGGLRVVASTDLRNIYSQIALSSPGLRGVPQGQIYSGSPGKEGKVSIQAISK